MQTLSLVVAYLAGVVFLLAVIFRIRHWVRMPMHVRWELYPVPHEGKRAAHGGSYLEDGEWWKKPRKTSKLNELKVMLPEIFFLVALREHNRRLWYSSFPFHLGLYCVAACSVLMIGVGVIPALRLDFLVNGCIPVLGYAGLVLGVIGALGLIHRRTTDPGLRNFTNPADFLNLWLFVGVLGFALITALASSTGFSAITAGVYALVTFNSSVAVAPGAAGWMVPLSVITMSALLAYIPMTHMSHFVGKFFAFHRIRWDDRPNVRGGPLEGDIQKVLGGRVGWNAPHIRGGEQQSWGESAQQAAQQEAQQ